MSDSHANRRDRWKLEVHSGLPKTVILTTVWIPSNVMFFEGRDSRF